MIERVVEDGVVGKRELINMNHVVRAVLTDNDEFIDSVDYWLVTGEHVTITNLSQAIHFWNEYENFLNYNERVLDMFGEQNARLDEIHERLGSGLSDLTELLGGLENVDADEISFPIVNAIENLSNFI